MSELHKSFAKSQLGKLPPEAPTFDSMSEDARDEDGSSVSSASSTGTLVPSPTRQLFARAGRRSVSRSFAYSRHNSPNCPLPSAQMTGYEYDLTSSLCNLQIIITTIFEMDRLF